MGEWKPKPPPKMKFWRGAISAAEAQGKPRGKCGLIVLAMVASASLLALLAVLDGVRVIA